MANYTYRHTCDGDNIIQWNDSCPIAKRDDPRPCPRCNLVASHIRMVSAPAFNFAEVDKIGDSSKPAEYWENAEREKRKRLIKEQDETLEKAVYNDPTCPEKYKQLKNCVK